MSYVEERYSRSIQSSHLEVTEFAGDVDSLIAAGWIRDGLATTLYRLRVEFDACDMRSIRPLPMDEPPEYATEFDWKLADWKKREVARIKKDFEDRRLVAKALALVEMKSLPAARQAIGRFVMAQATRERLETAPDEELTLAGQILDFVLDPGCTVCHGVRFKTVPGTGRLSNMPCQACDGSGKRPLKFAGSNDAKTVQFTRSILADIERKLDRVNELMKKFTRASSKAKAIELPAGAAYARPRIDGAGWVFFEFSGDGKAWWREKSPTIA